MARKRRDLVGPEDLPVANDLRAFGGTKHARFHDPNCVYHVLLRTVRGHFLLRPDDGSQLNNVISGVIARALELFPSVRLYADAWLSNHAHLLLQGAPDHIPAFVGFVEREISRRLGAMIRWDGNMFQRYQSTALPTLESQIRAFRYVLAQSTKEHLVDSPVRWPGVHCAKDLVRSLVRKGRWFDGTAYGKALFRRLSRKRRTAPPNRRDFERETKFSFAKLPAKADLSDQAYQHWVKEIVGEIEAEAAADRHRTGRKLLGRRRILRIPRHTRSALPRPPWYENRRRMVCWAARWARATRDYLDRYWAFQRAFRQASQRLLAGELEAPFPAGAFRPSSFVFPSSH